MKEVRAKNGMVTSGHPLTARVGIDVLQNGGNAIDAVVAAALAQMVVRPANAGLGAFGGCMVLHDAATGRNAAIDFNGCAPLAAREDMFKLEPAEIRSTVISREIGVNVENDEMTRGPKSIAVPGTLAGLGVAHEKFGSLPWARLAKPAVDLAHDGFPVSASLANSISALAHSGRDFPVTIEMFMPQGRPPKPGDTIRLPGMARTFQRIAEEGWRALYESDMAERVAEYVQSIGGILAVEDMKQYEARVCEPYSVTYRNHQISTPPLSNGGATTLQILSILSGFPVAEWDREAPELIHLLAEAFKLSWKDRGEYFGDPNFVAVNIEEFLSSEHARSHQEFIRSGFPQDVSHGQRNGPPTCTTHVCAADGMRNFASLTMSHGMSYGSLVTIPALGIVMNHGMCRLDPRPGRKNSIAPGKRILNNMSPALVCRDGKPVMAAGAVGGRHIINAVAQLLVNIIDFKMSCSDALDAPRCYCEDAEPIVLERRENRSRRDDQSPFPEERERIGVKIDWRDGDGLFKALSAMGHGAEFSGAAGGSAHVIAFDEATGEFVSGSDPRSLCGVVGF